MKQVFPLFSVVLLFSACGEITLPGDSEAGGAQSPSAQAGGAGAAIAPVPKDARTVSDFDTTTVEQKAAASAAGETAGGVALGKTIASLGAPTEPGFWLKTPLVDAPAKGKLTYAKTGLSVEVDLIPIDGPKTAGSRMSLPAMRLVGAPITGLPEISVFRLPE